MKRSLFVALLPLLAISCGAKPSDLSPNPDAPRSFRNGDAFSYSSPDASFRELTRDSTGQEIVARLNAGESIYLLWHQDGCHHCDVLREAFAPYIEHTRALIYSFDQHHLVEGIAVIEEAFPAMEETFPAAATPYLFYLDAQTKTAKRLDFTGQTSSEYDFTKFMYQYSSYENTYTFRSLSAFSSYCESSSCLAYIEDGEAYGPLLMEGVKQDRGDSTKPFAVLDYHYLNDEDKAVFDAKYGTPASSLLDFRDNKTPSLISTGQSQIIKDYFI